MTTPSGTIGLSDVNAELGYSPTAVITMNDAAVRTLAGAGGSGTLISMDDLRGKSNRVTITLTIASDTANYDVYSSAAPTYNPGKSDVYVTINPGVNVYSNSTGSSAFSVPGSFNPADTVTITNNGVIVGRGGGGGSGSSSPGSPGGSGGTGLSVSFPTTIANNNRIAGGGGGGGSGGGLFGVVGGGGGGGVAYGGGGPPNGGPGTVSSGGSGGGGQQSGVLYAGPGGPGGGYGSSGTGGSTGAFIEPENPYPNYNPGGGGGASGSAITGNSYITWTANGTKNGPVS